MFLSNLGEKDDLEKDWTFWKDYRRQLTQLIQGQEQEEKQEKTPKNIYDMAKKIGIKPTARYFEIQPCEVRYYIKKYEKQLCSN